MNIPRFGLAFNSTGLYCLSVIKVIIGCVPLFRPVEMEAEGGLAIISRIGSKV